MPSTQRAYFYTVAHEYKASERPIAKPASDQLLVQIKSISLSPVEWKMRHFSKLLIKQSPIVLGSDAAGDVVEAGENIHGFSENDRVSRRRRSWCVPGMRSRTRRNRPPNLSYNEAPFVFTTASVGLFAPSPAGSGLNPTFDPNVRYTGQSAFVVGGGTSAGQFVIQMLKALDFEHVITNPAAEHFDHLKSLGATHLLDRNKVPDSELLKVIKDIVGGNGKVDVAIDTAGTPTGLAAALTYLKDGVHVGTVGKIDASDIPEAKGRSVRNDLGLHLTRVQPNVWKDTLSENWRNV